MPGDSAKNYPMYRAKRRRRKGTTKGIVPRVSDEHEVLESVQRSSPVSARFQDEFTQSAFGFVDFLQT